MPDPLEAVWEPVLVPLLNRDAAVQAVILLRHLQVTDPAAFPGDRIRRTLERRVRDWRALRGPDRDVIFRQTSEPGRMALSDFTDASGLGVTIAGQPLAHRLHHFVLAYSGWEHAAVVPGDGGSSNTDETAPCASGWPTRGPGKRVRPDRAVTGRVGIPPEGAAGHA